MDVLFKIYLPFNIYKMSDEIVNAPVWGESVEISGSIPSIRKPQRSISKRRTSVAGPVGSKRRKKTTRTRVPKIPQPSYSEWLATLPDSSFIELENAALSAFDQQIETVKTLVEECEKRGIKHRMIVSHNKKKARGKMLFRDEVPEDCKRIFVGLKYAFNTSIEPHATSQSAWAVATAPKKTRSAAKKTTG